MTLKANERETEEMINQIRKLNGYKLPRLACWLARLAPITIKLEIVPGITGSLNLKDDAQRAVFWMGPNYEQRTMQILTQSDASAFFDIGANIGIFSYSMLAASTDTEVYSFEPNPILYLSQMETKVKNQLFRYHPKGIALSDQSRAEKLYINQRNSGYSSMAASNNNQPKTVQTRTFDQWLKGSNPPGQGQWVAKIDVEGYELKVLKGMTQALKAKHFYLLCIEINQHTLNLFNTSNREIYDFMAQQGYTATDDTGRPVQPIANEFRNVFFRL